METYLLDWANLLVRWLHLITGVAWIGASFYFVMLDMSLTRPGKKEDSERGVFGELWAVHGGGVYHSQKFLAGPVGEALSENLHWSKWEAYTTWLSGMGLLAIIYWFGANTYLIDRNVMEWSVWQAVAISGFSIVISWFIYDGLCRLSGDRESLLALLLFVYIMLCDWLLFQLFSARSVFIHVGSIMGTLLLENVFFHIIPGQKKMVQEIRAGQKPDPSYGIIGKQRSVHNTYFTLPVLIIMISNHYPMTYSHESGWLVLGFIMMAGVLIRQFFVLRHLHQNKRWLPLTGLALISAMVIWLKPDLSNSAGANTADVNSKVSFSEVKSIVDTRCVSCHADKPVQPGFVQPPKGIVLQSAEQLKQHAPMIAQTVGNQYMPIGNLTGMTALERQTISNWYAQGATTGAMIGE